MHHRSIQASLGCAGVAATGGDHGSLDCRISRRGGGNDFVTRLHRGRSHLSGVMRLDLSGVMSPSHEARSRVLTLN